MNLQEEYFKRRKVSAHLVKFADKTNLLLRPRSDGSWLHFSLMVQNEAHHPPYYQITLSTDPIMIVTPDFGNFQYQYNRHLINERCEWDGYESKLLEFADHFRPTHEAVYSGDAILSSWQLFCTSSDKWIANFLSHQALDKLYESLMATPDEKLEAVRWLEQYIRERYDRVWNCWKNVRNYVDPKSYADWLARIVNHDGQW